MSHLTLETMARLLDEPPAAAEIRHLESCADCRAELEAMREDREALTGLPDLLPPPPAAWAALERRLLEDGLIRTEAPVRRNAPGLRIAVGLALFVLGGASGFAVRNHLPAPSDAVPIAATSRDPDDASRALREAEAIYLAALQRYADLSTTYGADDPVARLSALEDIVFSTREALTAAPADPVINGYHLSALAQRDATMRQIALVSNPLWY